MYLDLSWVGYGDDYSDGCGDEQQLSALNPPFADVGLGELRISQEDLEGFSIPSLVIAGAQGRIFSLDVMKEVSQAIPQARFHVIPNAGHSPYFETPEVFNQV